MYSYTKKAYRLFVNEFLSDMEMYAVAKLIVESGVFPKDDAIRIISKLKRFTALKDCEAADRMVSREFSDYSGAIYACDSIMENIWRFASAIANRREVTVTYFEEDGSVSLRRIQPSLLDMSGKYFFLTACIAGSRGIPYHFRVDKVTKIVEHRKRFDL